MKKVMAFGTFDLLHEGHTYYLKKARERGDYLMVVVSLDRTVAQLKKQKPSQSQETRLRNVQALPTVDEAVLGQEGDKWKIIETHKPDIICLGYDQQAFTDHLKEGLAERGLRVQVVRIDAFQPEKYKTSKLRKK